MEMRYKWLFEQKNVFISPICVKPLHELQTCC